MSLATAIIHGRLTRDPETRFTSKGTAITQFSMAVNRVWKSADGEKREDVDFFEMVAFGKRGETIEKFVQKGKEIIVQAIPKQDTWEDKQTGAKRSKIIFQVENFSFVGGQNQDRPPSSGWDKKKTERKVDPEDYPDIVEDDVPF